MLQGRSASGSEGDSLSASVLERLVSLSQRVMTHRLLFPCRPLVAEVVEVLGQVC